MRIRNKLNFLGLYFSVFFLITSCGGSGGGASAAPSNRLPSFTSDSSSTAAENTIETIYTAVATDPDGDTLSYSLSGDDQGQFSIDSSSGALSFASAPDFENPSDANTSNDYQVTIRVSDGKGGADTLDLIVTVSDAAESPVFTSGNVTSVLENQILTDYIAVALDPEGDDVSYSIGGGDDQDKFIIDSLTGELNFINPPDYESPTDQDSNNEYKLSLAAEDESAGVALFELSVLVLNEASLAIEVTFPPSGSNAGGDSASLSFSGRIIDEEDGVVSETDVAALTVNGFRAGFSVSDPTSWSVGVLIDPGEQIVNLEVTDLNGNVKSIQQNLKNEGIILNAARSAFDRINQKLYLSEQFANNISEIDLIKGGLSIVNRSLPLESFDFNSESNSLIAATRSDELLSINPGTGLFETMFPPASSGIEFSFPRALELDADNKNAFILDTGLSAIVKVDMDTGERVVVSDDAQSTDVFKLRQAVSLTLDEANNRALVIWCGACRTISVDLDTGEQTLFSFGPQFAEAIVADPSRGNFLVSDGPFASLQIFDSVLDEYQTLSSSLVGDGPEFQYARGVEIDTVNDRAIVIDDISCSIFGVDLDTGDRSVLFDCAVASGNHFRSPEGIVMDGINNQIWMVDDSNRSIFSVDTASGNRSLVSGGTVAGFGISLSSSYDLDYDSVNDRVLVVDAGNNAVVEIDPVTGERKLVSSNSVGSGVDLEEPRGIAYDSVNNRVLLTEIFADRLVSIDLETGVRVIVSDSSTGSGTNFGQPRQLVIDHDNNRVLVENLFPAGILAVDLETGDRSLLSGGFSYPRGVDINDDRSILYVVDDGFDAVYAIDLISGDRTLLSGQGVGEGVDLVFPRGLTVDDKNNRLYVADEELNSIVVIDLESGDRAIFSR